MQIRADDPFLAAFIVEHLEVAPSGGALRVGHDRDGNSTVPGLGVGQRLPPYDFDARPKGVKGGYSLHLHVERSTADFGKTSHWQLSIQTF